MRRRLKKNTFIKLILALLCPVLGQAAEGTFNRELLYIAVKSNHSIQASVAAVNSAIGESIQAGLLPNPEVVLETENFAGSGNYSGFNSAEFTMGVQQTVEMGGKRFHRKNAANHATSKIRQQSIARILAILSEVQFSIVRYTVAKERLVLSKKRLGLANRTHNRVKVRVSAARDSELEHAKVDIEKKIAEIELGKAKKEFHVAKSQLSRLLGGRIDSTTDLDWVLKFLPALPEKNTVFQSTSHTSQNKIFEFNKLRAEANFKLAQAQAVPNPTIGIGARKFNDNKKTAFLASLSIPIPILDRNQGGIKQAREELVKARAEKEEGMLSIREEALKTWEEFSTALDEVRIYQKNIIPSAKKAYLRASEAFSAGRLSLLNLLDAQRTLIEVQEARLASILSLHQAKANMDFLMNSHIDIAMLVIK